MSRARCNARVARVPEGTRAGGGPYGPFVISSARYAVADFVRDCAASPGRRGRVDREALIRFAAYLEALPEDDRRADVLVSIAGGRTPYQPGRVVRTAIVGSLRRGADPASVLEALLVF